VQNQKMLHERLARELVFALRGRRSQPWLSRRLGLKSNLVYRWEAGRAWPSATQFFAIARVAGVPSAKRLEDWLGRATGLGSVDLESTEGVRALLERLAGPLGIGAVAERMERSRFVVSRWLSGQTRIRLPDLLRYVEATSLRLLDFVALFVDPARIGAIAADWKRIEAARRAAYDAPWSHAVLRVLELRDYESEGPVGEAWIAKRLGIDVHEARRSLGLLAKSGQIQRAGKRWRVRSAEVIDTGVDHERRRSLRAFWSRVAVDRLEAGVRGVHAFNIFTLAERDLPELRALHLEFFNRVRALADAAKASERVVCTPRKSWRSIAMGSGPRLNLTAFRANSGRHSTRVHIDSHSEAMECATVACALRGDFSH